MLQKNGVEKYDGVYMWYGYVTSNSPSMDNLRILTILHQKRALIETLFRPSLTVEYAVFDPSSFDQLC